MSIRQRFILLINRLSCNLSCSLVGWKWWLIHCLLFRTNHLASRVLQTSSHLTIRIRKGMWHCSSMRNTRLFLDILGLRTSMKFALGLFLMCLGVGFGMNSALSKDRFWLKWKSQGVFFAVRLVEVSAFYFLVRLWLLWPMLGVTTFILAKLGHCNLVWRLLRWFVTSRLLDKRRQLTFRFKVLLGSLSKTLLTTVTAVSDSASFSLFVFSRNRLGLLTGRGFW